MIISDSHDCIPNVRKLIEKALEKHVTRIFHLGDIVSPFMVPYFMESGTDFFGIFGNNDGEKLFLAQKFQNKIHSGPFELSTDGVKLFLMHEPYALLPAAKSQLYDFVLYGHTHKLDIHQDGKTLIINPGESCGYLTGHSTAVILNPNTKEYEIIEV